MTGKAAVLGLVMIGAAASAFAHNYLPATPGQAVTIIPDISVSRAAYRELRTPGQVDVYEFHASKGQGIYIQMTVPLIDRLSGFAPAFVLLSTDEGSVPFDSPAMEKGSLADPPHEVVDVVHPRAVGDGEEPPLLAVEYDGSAPVVFDEPFTSTRYWIRQTLTVKAPRDGTYRIGVYSPRGASGKYVLAPGRAEKFSLADVLSFGKVKKEVRAFCEVAN